jgi:predicted transport protein
MALGPKEMGEAIIRNLKTKTGKTLEEWIDVVQQAQLSEKKAVLQFLKTEHKLGHFQAQKIYEHLKGADAYAASDQFEDQLFKSPASRACYDHLKKQILGLSSDIKVQPCKTYIPFYHSIQFAQLSPAKEDQIKLKLSLPKGHEIPLSASKNTNGRLNTEILIQDKSEINQQVMDALALAYENN